jgi:hypothetical protein
MILFYNQILAGLVAGGMSMAEAEVLIEDFKQTVIEEDYGYQQEVINLRSGLEDARDVVRKLSYDLSNI